MPSPPTTSHPDQGPPRNPTPRNHRTRPETRPNPRIHHPPTDPRGRTPRTNPTTQQHLPNNLSSVTDSPGASSNNLKQGVANDKTKNQRRSRESKEAIQRKAFEYYLSLGRIECEEVAEKFEVPRRFMPGLHGLNVDRIYQHELRRRSGYVALLRGW